MIVDVLQPAKLIFTAVKACYAARKRKSNTTLAVPKNQYASGTHRRFPRRLSKEKRYGFLVPANLRTTSFLN